MPGVSALGRVYTISALFIVLVTISFAEFELPQINYRMYNGKKYSIIYGLVSYLSHGREAVCLITMY